MRAHLITKSVDGKVPTSSVFHIPTHQQTVEITERRHRMNFITNLFIFCTTLYFASSQSLLSEDSQDALAVLNPLALLSLVPLIISHSLSTVFEDLRRNWDLKRETALRNYLELVNSSLD
ncbi:hypothetical protein ScPMuIL_017905 [Solemya velum]